ncbi:MAG: peptidylprolyl isomerase [Betaproteobacteria bacterium]
MISILRNKLLHASLTSLVALAALLAPAASHATSVRLQTVKGPVDLVLYDNAAPRTVANFLSYVNSGAFNNSFIHRSVPGFIIQGGGYVWNDSSSNISSITTTAPVANEFSTARSNKRGTIAMAKVSGDPNSATSQWFINLADNSSSLDTQNGGFTVFGEVSAASMPVVDAIAALPISNAGGNFTELPLVSQPANGVVQKSNLVIINAAAAVTNNYQGMWWNANESGWGMNITQHGNMIFAAMYTYDDAGLPTWYVIPNCPVSTTNCTGDIYKVTGGTSPAVAWNGAGSIVTKVGAGTIAFSSTSSATFTFTINNISGSKAITPQVFATGSTPPVIDYSDMWWNANESGWGLSITQQFTTIFAAWYTYDATGKAIWYVVPNCAMSGAGCTGSLYQVTGGKPLTSAWTGTNAPVIVGSVTLAFASSNSATMAYTLNGVTSSRAITRQAF